MMLVNRILLIHIHLEELVMYSALVVLEPATLHQHLSTFPLQTLLGQLTCSISQNSHQRATSPRLLQTRHRAAQSIAYSRAGRNSLA
jgi:hypothetical protein